MSIREIYYRFRRKACHLAGNSKGVSRWSNVMASKDVLEVLHRHFDENETPSSINIEINTHCNYNCPFCPQSTLKRPVQLMLPSSFSLIINQLVELDYSMQVCLNINNEPFLHPKLMDFCKEISGRLPKAIGAVISNGSLIKKEDLEFLNELSHPPLLVVDDYTPDKKVEKRLRQWMSELENLRMRIEIKKRSWTEKLSNSAGNQPGCDTDPRDFHDIICTWPFTAMFITCDLKVFICCRDYVYDLILGDLAENDIMTIWKSGAYRNIRERMLATQRRDIEICSKCDAEWFLLPEYCVSKR